MANRKRGENTPDAIAAVCVNFWERLLYPEHKFPAENYKLFRVIEDYGVRLLNYGNAGGGHVAIDNEKTTHHSLQLVADDNVAILGDKVMFYHNGRIGCGIWTIQKSWLL